MYVNVKIRLATFASHLGMSDSQFEKSISMPANTLRRTESSVKAEVLTCAIQTYPQLSPDWLLTGDGPMLRPLNEHPAAVHTESSEGGQEPILNEQPQQYESKYTANTITIPVDVWDQLRKQLENKDKQIATLLSLIKQ